MLKQEKSIVRLAAGITVFNLFILIAYYGWLLVSGWPLQTSFRMVNAIVYSLIAVLIIRRNSRHTVGWLFLVVGFFSSLAEASGSPLDTYLQSSVLRAWASWVGHVAWLPWGLIPITLILLYFPNGLLLSPRWRPVAFAAAGGIVGFIASFGLHPWPWEEGGILTAYNPMGIPGSEAMIEKLFSVSIGLTVIGSLGGLVSVWLRFRASVGLLRTQMKWLFYPAAVCLSIFLVSALVAGIENPLINLLFPAFPTLFAVMIGIAILRHQLFDIDIIIRRTLQYAILTGFVVLLYYGGVVLLQSGIGLLTGVGESPLVTVLTTLLIAAFFNPLRRRVQEFVDRRFYRSRYNAEQTLARFAATARDEVDVQRFSDALLRTVEDTMQPMESSLWLKQDR